MAKKPKKENTVEADNKNSLVTEEQTPDNLSPAPEGQPQASTPDAGPADPPDAKAKAKSGNSGTKAAEKTPKPEVKKPAIKKPEGYKPVEEWGKAASLPSWELPGLKRALNWADGKEIDEDTFNEALKAYRNRPAGGGRLVLKGGK